MLIKHKRNEAIAASPIVNGITELADDVGGGTEAWWTP